jgi:hypothetical protein
MILSLCLFGGRLRDSLVVLYHLTTMWLSKLYQRSERDAVLLNIRDDFAELISVDPIACTYYYDKARKEICSTASSKLIKLEAPLKLINSRVELLKSKGYKEQDHIDLSLRDLAAV